VGGSPAFPRGWRMSRRWERKKDTGQTSLFDPPRTAATSLAAFAAVQPRLTGNRAKVRAWMLSRGQFGATREEASQDLGILLQTMCGVFRDLAKAGQIKDSGVTRLTKSGHSASVFIAIREAT
jgi:hypothetical protein